MKSCGHFLDSTPGQDSGCFFNTYANVGSQNSLSVATGLASGITVRWHWMPSIVPVCSLTAMWLPSCNSEYLESVS